MYALSSDVAGPVTGQVDHELRHLPCAGITAVGHQGQPLGFEGLQGLWIAAGHEGLGITLSPITGRLLAEQLTGRPTTIDATPYLPARFLR